MKTLILYATKHGAAEKCAFQLGEELQAIVENVHQFKGDLSEYERIILGSSIYGGVVDKKMKEFCHHHGEELKTKQIWFYICGILKDAAAIKKELEDNFGAAFVNDLQGYFGFGGILDMAKMNFMERKILQMVNKKMQIVDELQKGNYYDMLDQAAIMELIKEVRS